MVRENSKRWALLVASQHGKSAALGMPTRERQREVVQLLRRAESIASPSRTCAMIAEGFESEWQALALDLPPHNLVIQPKSLSALEGIERILLSIRAREEGSSVILIPADHCAAVETVWVTSAKAALQLASSQPGTVYLLHDKPQPDVSPFSASTALCSTTVVVGSTDSLLELCQGTRPTRVIELDAEDRAEPESVVDSSATPPIDIVHVHSLEEYERLQSGRYLQAKARIIDVTA